MKKRNPATLRKVMIPQDGYCWVAILYREKSGYLILKNAVRVEPGKPDVPADGEILVPREKIEYIQTMGA